MPEKIKPNEIIAKTVVTKEGKKLGNVKDVVFETRTGELIQIVLSNATDYANNLNLEQTKNRELLVPWHSVIAVGDFVVVNEEDIV